MGDLRLELFVEDVDRAVAFYVDMLGFEPRAGGYRTYRPVERQGIRLALQSVDELDAAHPLRRDGQHAMRGLGVEIVLEVDDLDELHERLTTLGVDVSPLVLQPWGLRDFRLFDPDGYYLRCTTPDPAQTRPDPVR